MLWERAFHCSDLGRDLVPVIQAFHALDAFRTGIPGPPDPTAPEIAQDYETAAPAPLLLRSWLADHSASLAAGAELEPFAGVPSDLHVTVHGGSSHVARPAAEKELWLCLVDGDAELYSDVSDAPTKLASGGCVVVPPGTPLSLQLGRGAVALSVGFSRLVDGNA